MWADLESLHVLVVDEDPVFLDTFEIMIQAAKLKMLTRASSGRDAFAKWRGSPRVVDCVLCECKMADGNGLQLLHAARTGQIKFARPDSCFILMASVGEPGIVATSVRLDVSGFLIKPLTPELLVSAVSKARKRAIKIDLARYKEVAIPEF